MKTALPRHGYEGQRATPRPIPAAARILVVDDVPSAEELARRGLSFEPVHYAHAEPVRLRLHGEGLGIFAARRLAAPLIKNLPVLFFVFLLVCPSLRAAPDYTMRGLLDAIRLVEGYQGRPGAAGEIGPWQMMPSVRAKHLRWVKERTPAFAQAQLASEESLAMMQIWSIQRDLRRRGAADCAFNIALCWNAGSPAALSGRAPERSYDYARRVVASMEGTK